MTNMETTTKADEKNRVQQKRPDYFLISLGVFLLLIPLLLVLIDDAAYDKAGFFLRVIAALGAGLIGAALPGFLHVELPFARAGGALAIFLLVYSVNPPEQSLKAFHLLNDEERGSNEVIPSKKIDNQISKINHEGGGLIKKESEIEDSTFMKQKLAFSNEGSGNGDTETQVTDQESSVSDEPLKSDEVNEVKWATVLGTSWVKPSNWFGKHYFLPVEGDFYIWPTEIDESNKRARFIINTSKNNRVSGKRLVNNIWINERQSHQFDHNGMEYRITLVDIRHAGKLPTNAAYVKVEVKKD